MKGRFKMPMWIFPLIIAGFVAAFGWWGNGQLRNTIENKLKSDLTTTLNANVTTLEIWIANQKRLASSLAEQPELGAIATNLLEQFSQQTQGGRPPSRIPELQFRIYLENRLRNMGYSTAMLVNTNFQVVASVSAPPPISTNFNQFPNFGMGRGGPPPPRPGSRISEALTNKFAELFTSGESVLITPYIETMGFGGGGRRGFGRGSANNFPGGGSRDISPPGSGNTNYPPRGGPGGMSLFGRGATNNFSRGGLGGPGGRPGPPRLGDRTLMQVAAPIRDAQDKMIGALALMINPEYEFTKGLSASQTGVSGETYAFDQTGLLISRSRFDEQLLKIGLLTNDTSALNLRLHDPGSDLTEDSKFDRASIATNGLTRIVANALSSDEEGVDIQPSRDYRGVMVVGAWKWLPQFGFGVATQINADEAYRPLRVLKIVFTMLSLLLVLCATGMFAFSYANVASQKRLGEAELKLKQLGQYQLEEKIGEGGMGVVYRARHALMRRDTAVKLLLPDRVNKVSLERFEREVVLTCQLTHPNTIQVYDYGHTPEGIFYYAMEYLRGLNLHDLIGRYGTPSEGRVIHILAQICDSLAEAHAMGLVHRDIKPANVFLCDRGGIPDSVKVLDFGLVREYSGANSEKKHLTGEEGFVGTPLFMAPEAIKSSAISNPLSDIYSVGALAYYLLTSHYVFFGDSAIEIHEQQLTSKLVPPSQRTANPISKELEQAILRCLERDPKLRPQSVGELRAQLLASPHAFAWTLKMQTEWWANFHAQEKLASSKAATATASPVPTVKIDFASRI